MLKIVSSKILRVSPEFTEPVLSFQHTAFRLKVRDRYNEPSEAGTVHRFLDSGELDGSLPATWTANIGKRTEGGRRMERVQVVSEPHSAIRNRRGCSVRLWQHVGGTGAQSTFSNGADDGFLANNAIGDNRASAVDVCV